jgi:3-hydroxyisobutyrate dehydrogenase/glyoxylate/succinic semialdehyde reductase
MKIGFIGLGIMGSRMAANLLKHGHALVVYNRTADKAQELIALGAEWAASPAALAAQADIIFTMLAHPAAVREAALGPDGFLSALGPQRLWVDCSTVDPAFSKEMAGQARALGVRFLDAPVTGSKGPAAGATLVFWVGGAAADLESCRQFLEGMGSRIVHCGGPGAGTSLKMVMNQLLGTGMAAFAEAMVLGEALALPRQKLFEALLGSPAVAPFVALKRERIEQGAYEPADFPLRWLQKDLHLVATSAQAAGVAMPLTNAAKELYRLAIRSGYGDKDMSAIYDCLARNEETQPTAPG